jgi:hypothetical protein
VFVATVSGVGPTQTGFQGGDRGFYFSECQLRDGAGNFMGNGVASGEIGTDAVLYDLSTITINGGIFVSPGDSKYIDVLCRNTSGDGQIKGVQILTMEVGGFF